MIERPGFSEPTSEDADAHPSDSIGKLLKITDVCRDVGLSRAMIYRCIKQENHPFPRPVKIGYASRWREADVIAWKTALMPGHN